MDLNLQGRNLAQALSNSKYLECGSMPNVMAALPNISGALCSVPQSLPDAAAGVPTAVQ